MGGPPIDLCRRKRSHRGVRPVPRQQVGDATHQGGVDTGGAAEAKVVEARRQQRRRRAALDRRLERGLHHVPRAAGQGGNGGAIPSVGEHGFEPGGEGGEIANSSNREQRDVGVHHTPRRQGAHGHREPAVTLGDDAVEQGGGEGVGCRAGRRVRRPKRGSRFNVRHRPPPVQPAFENVFHAKPDGARVGGVAFEAGAEAGVLRW